MEDERNESNKRFLLPEYSKLLSFPNFKSKLKKKLIVKKDSLIMKKALEENKNNNKKVIEYINYLDAEIKLIQYLIDNKDINDNV